MPERIYHTTNNVGTIMKFDKKTANFSQKTLDENIGTCAALSSLFLKNFLTKRVEMTNPDKVLAQIIFSKCWMKLSHDPDKFNKANIEAAQLTVGNCILHHDMDESIKYMCRNAGHYYIDLREGHIVAAVNTGAKWYFFDSNDYGLWKFNSANEFFIEVKGRLMGFGWTGNIGIWTYEVS
jgi:hypothetical protein